MKALSLFLLVGISVSALADSVTIPVERVFVPVGFDNNDKVVVVLDGYLPDPCHKLSDTVVVREPGSSSIRIEQTATRETGFCPDVTVPFTKEVELGTLETGKYHVLLKGSHETEHLMVKESSKELPDDYLYAPIDSIRTFVDGKDVYAILQGRYTSNCLSMDQYKTTLTGNTIQLLPIMKLDKTGPLGEQCESTERFFEVSVKLPELENQRYLLHVRSLDGQSRNLVFNPYINSGE